MEVTGQTECYHEELQLQYLTHPTRGIKGGGSSPRSGEACGAVMPDTLCCQSQTSVKVQQSTALQVSRLAPTGVHHTYDAHFDAGRAADVTGPDCEGLRGARLQAARASLDNLQLLRGAPPAQQ